MRNRILMGLTVALAFGALVWGAMYDEDTTPEAAVFSGGAADGGGERDAEQVELDINPIEGWYPQSGVGSTCSEPVGVDLVTGYAAELSINGQLIPDTELNIYENPEAPAIERVLTSAGALGQYTWGPEEDCPNGTLLRPEDNTVAVCIYRISEGPDTCKPYGPFTFDAL